MTSSQDRRLQSVTGAGLTARERARLVHRAWIEEEDPDERLTKYMPPEQRPEYDRLMWALSDANGKATESVAYRIEWTVHLELRLAWLLTLTAYQEREAFLLARLPRRKKPLALPALPVPSLGIDRDMPVLWQFDLDQNEPAPATWEGVREKFEEDTHAEIGLRWQEQQATDAAFAELNEVWGDEVMATDVRRANDACRKKLLQLHDVHQDLAGEWPLPGPDDELSARVHGWFLWEDLKDTTATPAWDPRKNLTVQAREELEAQEAEWADALRD